MKLLKSILGLFVLAAVFLLGQSDTAHEVCNFVSQDKGTISIAAAPLLIQFSNQVEKRAVQNDGFLKYCIDESSLINGSEVRRPVEGDDPVAVTNPTNFPLPVEEKDDDTNTYSIALHATNPQRIADDMLLQVNYDARQLIIDKHMRVIDHKVAREVLHTWSPTNVNSNIVASTGASVAASLTKWGATGNRLAITKNNLIDGVTKIKEDDAEDGTLMLIPAGFENQLRKIGDFVDYQLTGRADMLANGIIGRIMGCNVMYRSTALIYDTTGLVPTKPTFVKGSNKISVRASACQGILIWSPQYVYKAIGKTEVYIDPKNGQYLGGLVNFAKRAGGNLRKDEMGVVAVVETTV